MTSLTKSCLSSFGLILIDFPWYVCQANQVARSPAQGYRVSTTRLESRLVSKLCFRIVPCSNPSRWSSSSLGLPPSKNCLSATFEETNTVPTAQPQRYWSATTAQSQAC
jgi:hypothetical protein